MRDLTVFYGPLARYSDHKIGDSISFSEGAIIKRGVIIWVTEPGQVIVEGGKPHGLEYIIDASDGFPDVVVPGQIIVH